MKKLLITAGLLFATLGASAQFHADLRAGATASAIGDQHLKMGIRAGAGVEYLFTERWGLRSGLFFSMKGATTSNNVFNYDADKATRLSCLDLPGRSPRLVPPLTTLAAGPARRSLRLLPAPSVRARRRRFRRSPLGDRGRFRRGFHHRAFRHRPRNSIRTDAADETRLRPQHDLRRDAGLSVLNPAPANKKTPLPVRERRFSDTPQNGPTGITRPAALSDY